MKDSVSQNPSAVNMLNKEIIISVLRITFSHKVCTTVYSKNTTVTLRIVIIEKSELTFLSMTDVDKNLEKEQTRQSVQEWTK